MALLTRRAVGLLVPSAQVAYGDGSVKDALDAQALAQQQIQVELEANYRMEAQSGLALAPVNVGAGVSVLYPLPAISPAPDTWRPEFWANVDGVIVGSNDLGAVYEVACSLSFEDDGGQAITWTWVLARGRDFDTVPVIAERVSMPIQISNVGEPNGATLHGMFRMPDSGPDTEIGLFAAHNGGSARNVTINSIQLVAMKDGNLDQM